MKRINKQNGITLIALVITIIVMLILVSVTISMAINGNLFSYAGKGAQKTEQAKQEEQELSSGRIQVDGIWYDSLQAVADGIPSENQNGAILLKNYNDTEKDDTKNGVLKANAYWIDYDEKGNEKARAVVPKGFKVIKGLNNTQSIEDGLVIQDEEGNEFVWIPVEVKDTDTETSIASFYRSAWDNNVRTEKLTSTSTPTESFGWSLFTEPLENGYSEGNGKEESQHYYDMLKSVYLNKGFYIGRYEAGSKIPRTGRANGTTEMVVKRDMYPYNCVSWGVNIIDYTSHISGWGDYEGDQGLGAFALSKNMYSNKDVGVTSTLCYGVMWDAMLDFVKDEKSVTDSRDWGNYYDNTGETWKITRSEAKYSKDNGETWTRVGTSGKTKESSEAILLTTGANDNFSVKNIYDIAGNLRELTNEAISDFLRASRGETWGSAGTYCSAAYRCTDSTFQGSASISLRFQASSLYNC